MPYCSSTMGKYYDKSTHAMGGVVKYFYPLNKNAFETASGH